MAIYFFLSGLGSVFTYMVALNTNVINFDEKHRGKIVGLLNACFAGSPSIFAVIYYHVIGNPSSSESFTTIMLLFAIAFGVTDIICMIFLRIYPKPLELSEHREMKTNISVEDSQSKTCCDNMKNRRNNEGTPLRDLLRNVDYYIFTLTFTFSSTVGLVYVVTLTQTTDAMNFSSHDPDVVLIVPITNALISVSIGIFSDYFRERFPRLAILIAGCVVFTVCQLIIVLLADGYAWIVLATVFCGIGIGLVWSIAPTVMSEYFSVENLGRNWGLAMFFGSLVGLGAQESFGAFYDAAKKDPGDLNCYGIECIRRGHAVVLASGIASIILGVILLIKRRNFRPNGFERF
ncbi:probable transporter MCH1 [Mizuhopecten yessoensis]|nr:probable transporter MCH1 [Mizuhopecten yessoensis]